MNRTSKNEGDPPGERGVSPVVGLVLLFGLIAVASTMILVGGVDSTQDARAEITDQEAAETMGQFRAEMQNVLAERAGTAEVRFPEIDDKSVAVTRQSKLSLSVQGYNASGAWVACDPVTKDLGAVRYGEGEDVLGYQANGVFRLNGNESAVVSQPGIEYREATLDGKRVRVVDVPIVSVAADDGGVGGDDLFATHTDRTRLPVCGNHSEPVKIKSITLSVENTDFYRGWAEFLRNEFGDVGTVVVDASNETVTVSGIELGVVGGNGSSGGPGGLVWARDDRATRRTVHNVRWSVGTAASSNLVGGGPSRLDEVVVDYDSSSDVNLSDVDASDVHVTIDPPARGGMTSYDATVTGVRTSDGGTTLTVETAGNQVVPANSEIVVGYGDAVNPSSNGSYPVDVTMVGTVGSETRSGTLEIGPSGIPPGARDGDGDGIADSVDECPRTNATGENGCDPITESGGTLTVNQSSGTAVLLGTEMADETTQQRSVAERPPVDVMFVLDRSGSMAYSSYKSPDWRQFAGADERWTSWDRLGRGDGGQFEVPSNEQWAVYDGSYRVYDEGESVDLDPGDYLRHRFVDEDAVSDVPTGETYLLVDTDGDVASAPFTISGNGARWALPGDTIDTSKWELYRPANPGNDPRKKRVSATESFLAALNASTDEAGFVDFNANAYVEEGLGDVGDLRGSVTTEGWGRTSITSGLSAARGQLGGGSDKKVIVLLSDGENSNLDCNRYGCRGDNTDENRATLNQARAAKRNGYTIYTVALGDDADESLLAKVAGNESTVSDGQGPSSGFAYRTDNADDLESIFDQIAGEVSQRRIRTVEYAQTRTQLQVNGTGQSIGSATGLAGPGAASGTFDHGVGATLGLSTTAWFGCEQGHTAGNATHNGANYTQVRCSSTRNGSASADSSTASNRVVLTDADNGLRLSSLGYGTEWYRNTTRELVNGYDPSLTQSGGDRLDLGPNQALIVVGLGDGNFSVVYYEADDSPPPGVSNPATGGGGGNANGFGNGYVVTVSGQEVVVGDDDESN